MPVDPAVRIYSFAAIIGTGTTPTSPGTFKWFTENNYLRWIEIEIPPGHNGLTGVQLVKGETLFLPFAGYQWIVANDYVHRFEVNDYVSTSDLQIQAYNTGIYDHTFYFRMAVSTYTKPSAALSAQLQPLSALQTQQPSADPLSPDAILGPDLIGSVDSGLATPAQAAASVVLPWRYPAPDDITYTPARPYGAVFTWKEPLSKGQLKPFGYYWELINYQGVAVQHGHVVKPEVTLEGLLPESDYIFSVHGQRPGHNGDNGTLRFTARVPPPVPPHHIPPKVVKHDKSHRRPPRL